MGELLFWIYLINAVLLINHEIDSAYWKEWDLFGLPGGITGFLLIHFPLLFLILYGLVLVYQLTIAGLILSLALSLGGVFALNLPIVVIVAEWCVVFVWLCGACILRDDEQEKYRCPCNAVMSVLFHGNSNTMFEVVI